MTRAKKVKTPRLVGADCCETADGFELFSSLIVKRFQPLSTGRGCEL